jgi:hypothetical protein
MLLVHMALRQHTARPLTATALAKRTQLLVHTAARAH